MQLRSRHLRVAADSSRRLRPNYAHQRIVTHSAPVFHYAHPPPTIVTVHKTSASPVLYSGWQAPVTAYAKPASIATHVHAPVFTAVAFKHPVTTAKLIQTHQHHPHVLTSHHQAYVPPVPIGRAIVTSYFNVPGSSTSGAPAGFPSLDADRAPGQSNVLPQSGIRSTGGRIEDYNRRGWIRPSAPAYRPQNEDRLEDYGAGSWARPSGSTFKPQAESLFVGPLDNDERPAMRKHLNLVTPSEQVPRYPVPTRLGESSSWPAPLQDGAPQVRYGARVARGAARRRGGGVSPGFGDRGELRWPFEIDFEALNKQAKESSDQAETAAADSDDNGSSA
ncbi:hypothetical protein V5799_018372 [Amblyomma americanum]|uniref:Uncharacterized protein n=1 Tax=Amblyomma americanum TaxID=6943 RepID=A0AAQ4EZN3_AMBAM